MQVPLRLAALLWYGTGLVLFLLLVRGPGLRALDRVRAPESATTSVDWLDLGLVGLACLLLFGFFVLVGTLASGVLRNALYLREPVQAEEAHLTAQSKCRVKPFPPSSWRTPAGWELRFPSRPPSESGCRTELCVRSSFAAKG